MSTTPQYILLRPILILYFLVFPFLLGSSHFWYLLCTSLPSSPKHNILCKYQSVRNILISYLANIRILLEHSSGALHITVCQESRVSWVGEICVTESCVRVALSANCKKHTGKLQYPLHKFWILSLNTVCVCVVCVCVCVWCVCVCVSAKTWPLLNQVADFSFNIVCIKWCWRPTKSRISLFLITSNKTWRQNEHVKRQTMKQPSGFLYVSVSVHHNSILYKEPTRCNFGRRSLYMLRTLSASVIRSTKNCSNSHWCMSWVGMMYIQ